MPTQSVATRLRACLVTRFSAVDTGIGSNWHEQIIPDETNIRFPCGILTVDGLSETFVPKLSGKDDWIRPVKVMICDRCDQYDHGRLPDYELWRERLMRSVNQQRVPGLPESLITTVEPLIIVDPNMPKFQFLVSGFIVRAQTREARGLNV
jgi:hypothetical protein